MAIKQCELCGETRRIEMRFGVNLCTECYEGYRKAMAGNADYHAHFSNPANFPYATQKALKEIVNIVANINLVDMQLAAQKAYNAKNINYAPSYNASYPTYTSYPTQPANTAIYTAPIKTNSEPFLDSLYKNIGKKLKNWAKWIFIVEAIVAIISGFGMILSGEEELLLIGIILLIAGPLVAWVSSWLLYAFGELVDKTCDNEHHTREILRIMEENKNQ